MSRPNTPPDASASSQSHWARARGILRGTRGPLAPRVWAACQATPWG